MRTLLLLRGAPGCGKSTFIEKNGLKDYALSADDIRLLCQSPQQLPNGEYTISQRNEKIVWEVLFNLLKVRMEKGEFTVIDATNSKTEEMNRYRVLASEYRYRMYLIDFTDLPIEECKRRNAERPAFKVVPEEVIDRMYSRFRTQKVPSQIKVLKPNELDQIWFKPINLSHYKKIVHIGDIHGCYTALMDYLKGGELDPETFYIFTGDFVDRGIENVEVMRYMFSIQDKPNVLFIEGNHEKWLWMYGNDEVCPSKEFEYRTKRDFQQSDLKQQDFRMFYRKIAQCAWYYYGDKQIFVCHGGLARLPSNLTMMPTSQMIKGVGEYDDYAEIADTWMRDSPANAYQIHGHRNTKDDPIQVRERVFNLEGRVEFGGCLRAVELTAEGFKTVETQNKVFRDIPQGEDKVVENDVMSLVTYMRSDKGCIEEKNFGHISSFNFTRQVFSKKKLWDTMRTKARGLYIDIDKMKVAARSYNKFFNIGEMPFTEFKVLPSKLQFPVSAYVKENGYLVLVSYDEYGDYKDNLIVTSKSSITGDYSVWARNILDGILEPSKKMMLTQFCKLNDVTLVFECIDVVNDPHIIEYRKSDLILLAIVHNDLEFKQETYEYLQQFGKDFGLTVKERDCVLKDWQEFHDWYVKVGECKNVWKDRIIEGFVIEDSAGFMVKIKMNYYNFWKHMRNVANKTLRTGYITQTSQLYDDTSNDFYGFCKRLYESAPTKDDRAKLPHDIITLRKMFLEEQRK